jgi:hypothetical protein
MIQDPDNDFLPILDPGSRGQKRHQIPATLIFRRMKNQITLFHLYENAKFSVRSAYTLCKARSQSQYKPIKIRRKMRGKHKGKQDFRIQIQSGPWTWLRKAKITTNRGKKDEDSCFKEL